MNLIPLIALSRGGTLECLHFGAVALVDANNQLLAQAGDPHWLTFSRSTLKPLQALPFMQADGARQFGFSQQQLAMLCASHNGEPQHVEQVQDMLSKAGLRGQDLRPGIDGCSAPNYAMPLSKLAYGYARLASGIQDSEFGPSFAALGEAMSQHPDLVSGTGRNDLALMRSGRGDWISKVGADGVQVLGSKSRRQAFAIKIIDGNKPALFAATVEVLDQLGWLDQTQREELEPWRAQNLLNARGLTVGKRAPAFTLQTARD
jgi:L-asparaginase II